LDPAGLAAVVPAVRLIGLTSGRALAHVTLNHVILPAPKSWNVWHWQSINLPSHTNNTHFENLKSDDRIVH